MVFSAKKNSVEMIFLYENGQLTSILKDFDTASNPMINDNGDILFTAERNKIPNGYLWKNGKIEALLPPKYYDSCYVFSINQKGDASGYCAAYKINPPSKKRVAVVWQNGEPQILKGPNIQSYSRSILNNHNEVAGSHAPYNVYFKDVPNGKFADISAPDGGLIQLWDFNDNGQIVGLTEASGTSFSQAFLWENDQLKNPGTLWNFKGSHAESINNNGQMIGSFTNNIFRPGLGYIYENERLADLSGGYPHTRPWDINENGEIVGAAGPSPLYENKVALWKEGRLHIIDNMTGMSECRGCGINNPGQLHGFCYDQQFKMHLFFWENGTYVNLTERVEQLP